MVKVSYVGKHVGLLKYFGCLFFMRKFRDCFPVHVVSVATVHHFFHEPLSIVYLIFLELVVLTAGGAVQ